MLNGGQKICASAKTFKYRITEFAEGLCTIKSSFDFLRVLSASVVRQAHYVLSPSKDAVRYESFITLETSAAEPQRYRSDSRKCAKQVLSPSATLRINSVKGGAKGI
jgi:hypothetical protein